MVNYLAFGCWNKFKDDSSERQTIIFQQIYEYIESSEISFDFLCLLGDNYYPNKKTVDGEKVKEYNDSNLKKGFELLNQIKLPKIFVHGNHDIKDFPEECQLLSMMAELDASVIDRKSNFYPKEIVRITENTIMFFLDSTIYELPDDLIISETCYKKLFDFLTPYFKDPPRLLSDIKDKQLEIVCSTLESNLDKPNIIFHFHHPIVSKRRKVDEIKTDYNEKLIDFYDSIKGLLNDKNIYHICADTHFYEYSIISIGGLNINQYIVGTGGADLDNPIEKSRIVINKNVIYDIQINLKKYGILLISEIEDSIQFRFISFDIPEELYTKYLKYKMKYLILNKLIKN